MTWLSNYAKRRAITLTGGSTATGYQQFLQARNDAGTDQNGLIYLAGDALDFPNDLRFTDNDELTLLSHYYEGAAYALSFNGTSDYCSLAAETNLAFTHSTAFTIEAMIKSSDAGRGIFLGDYATATEGAIIFEVNASGYLRAYVQAYLNPNITYKDYVYQTDITDGLRHHVAMTYDGAQTLKVYVDGAEVTVNKATDNTLNGNLRNSNRFKLGKDNRADPSTIWYSGELGPMRISNVARSAAYIADAALNHHRWNPDNNTVGLWDFASGSGNDLSSSNNDWTVTGPTTITLANLWVKVTDDLSTNPSVYLYYGKAGAGSASDGKATFDLFDDFSRSYAAISNYTLGATCQLANGHVLMCVRDIPIAAGPIKVLRSTDNMDTWSLLSTPWSTGMGDEPTIIQLSDGTVVIACATSPSGNMKLKKSADNGGTWGAEIAVSDSAVEASLLELASGNVMIVYTEFANADTTVRVSGDAGDTWGAAVTVFSDPTSRYEDPSICQLSTGKILCAAELEFTEGAYSKIMQKESTDGGAVWGNEVTIIDPTANVDNEGGSYDYVSDSEIYYVWSNDASDSEYGSYAQANIKELKSSDGGASYGSERTILDTGLIGVGALQVSAQRLANGERHLVATTYVSGAIDDTITALDDGKNYGTWKKLRANGAAGSVETAISGGELVITTDPNGNVYSGDLLNDPVVIEFRAKTSTTDVPYMYAGPYLAGTGLIAAQLNYGTLSAKRYATWDGAYTVNNMDSDQTQHANYRIDWTAAANVKFRHGGITKFTHTTNVPNAALPMSFFASSTGNTYTMTVDRVLARKYVATEPTLSVAAAESYVPVTGHAHFYKQPTLLRMGM